VLKSILYLRRKFVTSVNKGQPKLIDNRAINEHYCNDMQDGSWIKHQFTNRDSIRYYALASNMCLDGDDLVDSQPCNGGPASSSHALMLSN
jgi:hypothetical protein